MPQVGARPQVFAHQNAAQKPVAGKLRAQLRWVAHEDTASELSTFVFNQIRRRFARQAGASPEA